MRGVRKFSIFETHELKKKKKKQYFSKSEGGLVINEELKECLLKLWQFSLLCTGSFTDALIQTCLCQSLKGVVRFPYN